MKVFKNRKDAAIQLAEVLSKFKNKEVVVLAIPKGGIELGYPIAKILNAPLDIVLSKKIGHPNNSEFAIGAVSLQGVFLGDQWDVPENYIKEETHKIKQTLKDNYKRYRGDKAPVPLQGKIAIIVDDGIATGSTMIATVQAVKKEKPKQIIVAVPVAPTSIENKIRRLVDEYICLESREDFDAVGRFYISFDQVPEEKVSLLLKKNLH